nr:hypothetical protein [Tanacetum cinerariifolium]
MTTLAEHIIVVGAENRPPMIKKSMYDSWTSRIRLFIKGRKHVFLITATVSAFVVVFHIASDATFGVVEESNAFLWYPLSVRIGEVGGFRFGVALVIVGPWPAKCSSVTRANEKASPKVVGFDLKSAHCRAVLSPEI